MPCTTAYTQDLKLSSKKLYREVFDSIANKESQGLAKYGKEITPSLQISRLTRSMESFHFPESHLPVQTPHPEIKWVVVDRDFWVLHKRCTDGWRGFDISAMMWIFIAADDTVFVKMVQDRLERYFYDEFFGPDRAAFEIWLKGWCEGEWTTLSKGL